MMSGYGYVNTCTLQNDQPGSCTVSCSQYLYQCSVALYLCSVVLCSVAISSSFQTNTSNVLKILFFKSNYYGLYLLLHVSFSITLQTNGQQKKNRFTKEIKLFRFFHFVSLKKQERKLSRNYFVYAGCHSTVNNYSLSTLKPFLLLIWFMLLVNFHRKNKL